MFYGSLLLPWHVFANLMLGEFFNFGRISKMQAERTVGQLYPGPLQYLFKSKKILCVIFWLSNVRNNCLLLLFYSNEILCYRLVDQISIDMKMKDSKLRWGICSAGKICNDFVLALKVLPSAEHEVGQLLCIQLCLVHAGCFVADTFKWSMGLNKKQ